MNGFFIFVKYFMMNNNYIILFLRKVLLLFRSSDIYRRYLFDTLHHVIMNFWHTATTFIQYLSELSLTVSVDKPRMVYIFLKNMDIKI